MWLLYLGVSITLLLMVGYLLCIHFDSPNLSKSFKYLATVNIILFALIMGVLFEGGFNYAYLFIILGLVFILSADMALEEKNRPRTGDYMLKAGAFLCVMFKLCMLGALYFLAGSKFDWMILLYTAIIAIFVTTLIMILLKYVFKLYFREQFFNVTVYFFIVSLVKVSAIWYTFIIPELWIFAVFLILVLISDFMLVKLNFMLKKGKYTIMYIQRVIHYLSLCVLLLFMYNTLLYLPIWP